MTTTIIKPETDQLNTILTNQRNAFLRDSAPTLTHRRADLKNFRAALIGRENEIEHAINAGLAIAPDTKRISWKS